MQRRQRIAPKKRKVPKRNDRSQPKLSIDRNLWTVPDRMRVKLHYTDTLDMVNSAYKDANFIMRPTSIYDVDPRTGGRTSWGYQEWEPFYGRYRVHSAKISVKFANRENEACQAYILPINSDPGTNVADPSPYWGHPAARKAMCGSVYGKDHTTVTYRMTTLKMGAVSDFADDNFSAAFGANPTNDWFFFIGVYKGASLTLANGVTAYVDIDIIVDLYDKKTLQNGLLAPSLPTNLRRLPSVPGAPTPGVVKTIQ